MVARRVKEISRWRWGIAVAGLLAGLALVRVLMTRDSAALPPPPALAQHSGPVFADFLGAEACAECHQEKYQAWSASTHGRAGGLPDRKSVV